MNEMTFSKKLLNQAGDFLNKADINSEKYAQALSIINEWRSWHSNPLNVLQTNLKKRAKDIDIGYIFGQRLKKIKSIKAKLARFSDMQLSRMQDIGGCRVIFSTLENVREMEKKLERAYGEKTKSKMQIERKKDYI